MRSQIERYRQLGAMIRAAHSELGALQVHLVEAHERGLDPGELGVRIARLGRQISVWKDEQVNLFRHIAGEETASMSAAGCSRILARLIPVKACNPLAEESLFEFSPPGLADPVSLR
jgi:hypothetical protein